MDKKEIADEYFRMSFEWMKSKAIMRGLMTH
jgi:hypothetical protein